MIDSVEQLNVHEFEVGGHNIYVCFADVSDTDISSEKIRDILSIRRIEKINNLKNEKAARLSAGAELMLVYAVKKKYPNAAIPVEYNIDERGKPFFKGIEKAFFSLSHSGRIAACAISDAPVGVDVQCYRRPNLALAARFFSEREYKAVEKQPEKMFNSIWTRKEAVAKADGRGIAIGLKTLDIMDSSVRHSGKLYLTLDIPSPWSGYYIAVSKLIGVYQESDQG